MGWTSMGHWIIVVFAVLMLFGKGRITSAMGDLGRGLSVFRRELTDERAPPTE